MKKRLDVIKLSEDKKSVIILDETKLPNETIYLSLNKEQECYDAIKQLKVRGAPAIGVFAAYAIAVMSQSNKNETYQKFYAEFLRQKNYLNSSRPTAVNLSWALNQQTKLVEECNNKSVDEIRGALMENAIRIDKENEAMTYAIAKNGLPLLRDGDGILTHCNAGYLACLGYGTATAPVYLGYEKGMHFHVYSDETRPLLQGARLTSYELQKSGVDVTLICDNMASTVMRQGKIQAVFVGCDRIAANGDFANKIGTSGVAVLANYYHIPFYTLGPSSTIDFDCPSGENITIEERQADEIKTMWYETPKALKEVHCYNPAFDVTDHSLLTAIITEKGVVYPPFKENLAKLFQQK